MLRCRSCGRPAEEMGCCPWCSADMGTTRSTRFRLAVVAVVAVLLLCNKTLPESPAVLLLATLIAAVGFAASSPDSRTLLAIAVAAVAGSTLCHAFPETAIATGLRLRQHAVWLLPAASLVFACSGGAKLPPVLAETSRGRFGQVLKTPVFVMMLATLAATAAWLPPSSATRLAMALCYVVACYSIELPVALHAGSVFIFVFAFMSPNHAMSSTLQPSTAFAVAIASWGLVQGCIGMNRTGSEPSIHP